MKDRLTLTRHENIQMLKEQCLMDGDKLIHEIINAAHRSNWCTCFTFTMCILFCRLK